MNYNHDGAWRGMVGGMYGTVGPLQGEILGSYFRVRSFNMVTFFRLNQRVARNHPEIGNPTDGFAVMDLQGNVWQNRKLVGWFNPTMPGTSMTAPSAYEYR